MLYFTTVLIDYGQGTSPILPHKIVCGSNSNTLTNCSVVKLDTKKCTRAIGLDCTGTELKIYYIKAMFETSFLQLLVLPKV